MLAIGMFLALYSGCDQPINIHRDFPKLSRILDANLDDISAIDLGLNETPGVRYMAYRAHRTNTDELRLAVEDHATSQFEVLSLEKFNATGYIDLSITIDNEPFIVFTDNNTTPTVGIVELDGDMLNQNIITTVTNLIIGGLEAHFIEQHVLRISFFVQANQVEFRRFDFDVLENTVSNEQAYGLGFSIAPDKFNVSPQIIGNATGNDIDALVYYDFESQCRGAPKRGQLWAG